MPQTFSTQAVMRVLAPANHSPLWLRKTFRRAGVRDWQSAAAILDAGQLLLVSLCSVMAVRAPVTQEAQDLIWDAYADRIREYGNEVLTQEVLSTQPQEPVKVGALYLYDGTFSILSGWSGGYLDLRTGEEVTELPAAAFEVVVYNLYVWLIQQQSRVLEAQTSASRAPAAE